MSDARRIAMWSGPRNLSTALMYAFGARTDCAVLDEPFYAAFLAATGLDHPLRDAVLRSQPQDPDAVVARCLGPVPDGAAVFYQKHMTHHMLEAFPLAWLDAVTNVFLIRHPARVLASYRQKRERPTLADIGVVRQRELFERVRRSTGTAPAVLDSDDVLAAPGPMLSTLCAALDIEFQPGMLRWPAGGNAADGVWAPHWYGAVWKSTGLVARSPEPLPRLDPGLAALCEEALECYDALHRCRLRHGGVGARA